MHRIRTLCLCVFATAAVSASATAGASAAKPEWMTCSKAAREGKTYAGAYADKACTERVESGGKYELETLGHLKKATGKAKSGRVTLRTSSGVEVSCKSMAADTEVLVWTWFYWMWIRETTASKCVTTEQVQCTTAGRKTGTIALEPLMAWVVGLGEGRPGIILKPRKTAVASFECGGVPVTVTGSVLGSISGDVNTISKTATWTFGAAAGKQEFTTYEGSEEAPNVLVSEIDGAGPSESSLSATVTVQTEAMEVKT